MTTSNSANKDAGLVGGNMISFLNVQGKSEENMCGVSLIGRDVNCLFFRWGPVTNKNGTQQ
jgi:hypothetical protein